MERRKLYVGACHHIAKFGRLPTNTRALAPKTDRGNIELVIRTFGYGPPAGPKIFLTSRNIDCGLQDPTNNVCDPYPP